MDSTLSLMVLIFVSFTYCKCLIVTLYEYSMYELHFLWWSIFMLLIINHSPVPLPCWRRTKLHGHKHKVKENLVLHWTDFFFFIGKRCRRWWTAAIAWWWWTLSLPKVTSSVAPFLHFLFRCYWRLFLAATCFCCKDTYEFRFSC